MRLLNTTGLMVAAAIHMPTIQARQNCGYPLPAKPLVAGFCAPLAIFPLVGSVPTPASFLARMAFNALEHRNITQIHRMLERFVRFVTILAFVIGEGAQIDRVLKWSGLRIVFGQSGRVVDHRVADIAVVRNDFTGIADVLAIVTAEAARKIKVADVVRVGLPVGLHLWEKVTLKDTLNFSHGAVDRSLLLGVHLSVVRAIELVQTGID